MLGFIDLYVYIQRQSYLWYRINQDSRQNDPFRPTLPTFNFLKRVNLERDNSASKNQ